MLGVGLDARGRHADGGAYLSLRGITAPLGWSLFDVFDVSNDGLTLVGNASTRDGNRAWMAVIDPDYEPPPPDPTPVPEPGSLLLFGIGLA